MSEREPTAEEVAAEFGAMVRLYPNTQKAFEKRLVAAIEAYGAACAKRARAEAEREHVRMVKLGFDTMIRDAQHVASSEQMREAIAVEIKAAFENDHGVGGSYLAAAIRAMQIPERGEP